MMRAMSTRTIVYSNVFLARGPAGWRTLVGDADQVNFYRDRVARLASATGVPLQALCIQDRKHRPEQEEFARQMLELMIVIDFESQLSPSASTAADPDPTPPSNTHDPDME
jgi:hypothetical protein